MAIEDLGTPLTSPFAIPEGTARLYEHGVSIDGEGRTVAAVFKLPMVGLPHIAVGKPEKAAALAASAVSFMTGNWKLETLGAAIRSALKGRMALLPTGAAPAPVALTFGAPEVVVEADTPEQTTYGLPSLATLRERQLYDVAVRRDDGQWQAVAPNAVYYRSTWHDFGVAHITDIHLGRRIDFLPGTLRQLGREEAAERLYNWNDRFRGFVRYANYLHEIDVLDLILATGDIVDYLFEDDDDPEGGGNPFFARDLILGRNPSPGFEDVGPLRVPIFMVPGNHDYRRNRYRMVFNLDGGPINVKQVQNYGPYNLPWRDGVAVSRGDNGDDVPDLSAGTAAKMVEVDRFIRPFTEHLANRRYYVIELGDHRIVMLDSSWDEGMVTDTLNGLRVWFGWAEEDEKTFVGGSPNSEGVGSPELALVAETLRQAREGALVIVGIHAPLFNPWAEGYPYFFRETQRPALGHLVPLHLCRLDRFRGDNEDAAEHARLRHPTWFGAAGSAEPTYVKRGDNDDFFDYGVSRGKANELLRLVAGIGARRPVDVTLHGHVHRFNEFRISNVNGELRYYMDFYTHNPRSYYPTRFSTDLRNNDVTYVEVVESAPLNSEPTPMPREAFHKHVVQVPPYPKPLATAADPRGWWAEHRPLILQTEALGPLKDRQASFAGFRLLSVKNDVIDKIHFVSTQKLHERGYRWAWEEAIKPEPRRYEHLQRSRQYNSPEAAGVPRGYLPPASGMQNIVYRDKQGRMFELWRDGTGATGAGNLTQSAQNAPGAAGDPFVYVESTSGLQVVLYRGTDGHVNSIYWGAGVMGFDHLSSSVGAPKAAGNPAGYFEAAARINHVVYRKSDGHLHELWWTGQDSVSHGDITAGAGALKATGTPSPMLDTARGDHIVVYRATDGHIHSAYWSTGPIGHENLSGYARAPKAAGDPHAHYTAHDDAKQIVYRGVDGHIHELWWGGTAAVSHWDLSAPSGAPAADSDPVAFSSPDTNTKHVIYRAANGHLIELWWTPGGTPAYVDLSVEALAPPAIGKPGAFADGPHRHVVYRGADGHVHEIRWW